MGVEPREKTVYRQLMEFVSEPKARFLLRMYELKHHDEDWQPFSDRYLNGMSEDDAINKFKTQECFQKAHKYLLILLHNQRMIELYNIYFERAKEDTQAFKAFTDFSDKFFEDNINQLQSLLNGIDIDE